MVPELSQFLTDYPRMTVKPVASSTLVIEGQFCFSARVEGRVEITDSFRLRLEVPEAFPSGLPVVTELDRKIPRTGRYHVNPDGSLCLGSPLRLLLKLSNKPTICGFASDCLIPYLYAISHKLKFGVDLPFSELAHGSPGEFRDYADLLSLKSADQAERTIRLLGMKKRA